MKRLLSTIFAVIAFVWAASAQTYTFTDLRPFPSEPKWDSAVVCGVADTVAFQLASTSATPTSGVVVTMNLGTGLHYDGWVGGSAGVSLASVSADGKSLTINIPDISAGVPQKVYVKVYADCGIRFAWDVNPLTPITIAPVTP